MYFIEIIYFLLGCNVEMAAPLTLRENKSMCTWIKLRECAMPSLCNSLIFLRGRCVHGYQVCTTKNW
ncbi:hypothetical protein X975_13951, partial [Stegodyphus mimosarum]